MPTFAPTKRPLLRWTYASPAALNQRMPTSTLALRRELFTNCTRAPLVFHAYAAESTAHA
jgi:hypothetical protein